MPMTANNIWYPDDTAPVAPLEGLFSTMATSIDVQVSAVNVNGFPAVADQAGRLALYPTPAKGNRVWRKDLNYGEVYYDGTGSTTPGWYPMPGSDIGLWVQRATTDSWSVSTRLNILGITGTMPAGMYELTSVAYLMGPSAAGNAYLSVNGADVIAPPCDLVAGVRDSHNVQGLYSHAGGAMTAALDMLVSGSSSKTIYAGSSIRVRYRGPRK